MKKELPGGCVISRCGSSLPEGNFCFKRLFSKVISVL